MPSSKLRCRVETQGSRTSLTGLCKPPLWPILGAAPKGSAATALESPGGVY